MEIARRFIKERILSRDEFVLLLQQSADADVREMLRQEAFALCRKYYGNKAMTSCFLCVIISTENGLFLSWRR